MKTVLAIDPSIVCSGVVVLKGDELVAHGTIKTKLKEADRYREIQMQVADAIREYKPDVLAIEMQYLTGKNGDATLKTCTVKGICEGVFLQLVPHGKIIEVRPSEAKSALGVSGNAERSIAKDAAVKMAAVLFHVKVGNDVADAIGIGLFAQSRLKGLI